MPHVSILLFPGFSNMVLASLLEPLRAVVDMAGHDISWTLITPHGDAARSSSGLTIIPDASETECGPSDLLIVISGYGFREHTDRLTLSMLRRLARNSGEIIAADTGAWLIAAAGLMGQSPATVHWFELAEFREAFPDIDITKGRTEATGPIRCCGGATEAFDLIRTWIAEQFGPAEAFMASSMFHNGESNETATGPISSHATASPPMQRAVMIMAETLETPLSLDAIAARAHMSRRSLDRLFRNELQTSPGRYYQFMRLSRARDLAASSDYGLREIALRCGYSDAASLARAYRRHYGHPIRRGARAHHR